MKRTGKAFIVGAVIAMAFSSCGLFGGKKGTCPAYQKADSFQQHTTLK